MAVSHNSPTAPPPEDDGEQFPPVETADDVALAGEAEKLFCKIERTAARTLQDYLALANLLFRLSGMAMRLAGTNQRKGHVYSKALAQLLKGAPRLSYDANEKLRSALIGIAENRPAFDAWYGQLTGDQKQRWVAPRTLWDRFITRNTHWERQERKAVQGNRMRPMAALAEYQQREHDQAERIEQLERELAAAQDEIHVLGGQVDTLRRELDEARAQLAARYRPRRQRLANSEGKPMRPVPGAVLLREDFTEPEVQKRLRATLGGEADLSKADLVLFDMTPNAGANHENRRAPRITICDFKGSERVGWPSVIYPAPGSS
jgi:hypothetical protein